MSHAPETKKLPKWVFVGGDLALLATAAVIARLAGHPASSLALVSIVGLAALGAVLGVIPFLTDHARAQEQALDERQAGLAALTQTAASTAEQISIAAGGLHQIAGAAERSLRDADQTAHGLLERMAEMQAQLADARESGKEETARLESATDRVAKVAADQAKAEAGTRRTMEAALAGLTAKVGDLAALADRIAAIAEAMAKFERRLDGLQGAVDRLAVQQRTSAPEEFSQARIGSLPKAAAPAAPIVPIPPATASAPALSDQTSTPPPAQAPAPANTGASLSPAGAAPAPVPAPVPPASPAGSADASVPSAQSPAVPPSPLPSLPSISARVAARAQAHAQAVEAAAREADGPKGAPHPENGSAVAAPPALTGVPAPKPAAAPIPLATTPKPAPRSSSEMGQPDLGLRDEPAVSTDGATRLLVTSYIGIGNRLHLRGEGPGLSWAKGVPLQFVSIGRWRWETMDATQPVRFKIYKNDQTECAALGEGRLEPGRQQEVTATF